MKHKRVQEVPAHLKDGHYSGAKKLGHGEGYQYAHNFKDHFVHQEYMPLDVKYYEPTEQGLEKQIKARLDGFKKNSTLK